MVGDSGFVVYADGTVDYWIVRGKLGVFAVGKPSKDVEPPVNPPPSSGMCGIGLLPVMFVAASMFFVLRAGRGSCRKFT